MLKLTLFISQSWLFDFNATWKIFKELNSKWKRMSFSWVLGTFIYGFCCKQICNNTRIICRIKKKQLWKCKISFTNISLHGHIVFSDRIEDTFWTKTLDYTGFVSESRWNMKPLHQFIQFVIGWTWYIKRIYLLSLHRIKLFFFLYLNKTTNWFVEF